MPVKNLKHKPERVTSTVLSVLRMNLEFFASVKKNIVFKDFKITLAHHARSNVGLQTELPLPQRQFTASTLALKARDAAVDRLEFATKRNDLR